MLTGSYSIVVVRKISLRTNFDSVTCVTFYVADTIDRDSVLVIILKSYE